MATLTVNIPEANIIAALNGPGGAVSLWRDRVAQSIVAEAIATAPVNNVLNALHRGGVVGTYKASFGWARGHQGNQHSVSAVVSNFSDHALYVELGRGPSDRTQVFSWTGWGGQIRRVRATRGRVGQHILERALNTVYAAEV